MKITVQIQIDKSKEAVWSAISDIENSAQMISGIIKLTVLEKPMEGLVGLKWEETRKMFGKESSETMWITETVEGEYYCTRAVNQGAIYLTKMSVAETGTNMLLSTTFAGSSNSLFIKLLSSIMGLFVKKSMEKMLQADLIDIKRFIEQPKLQQTTAFKL